MTKLLKSVFLVCVFTLLACSANLDQDSQATVGITAPDGYAVACISGYSRTLPHFCSLAGASPSVNSLNLDNTCRNIDFTGTGPTPILPTATRLVLVQSNAVVTSTNALGIRQIVIQFWSDAACTVQFGSVQHAVREFANVTDGTQIHLNSSFMVLPIVSQRLYYQGSETGGANTLFSFIVSGYYD